MVIASLEISLFITLDGDLIRLFLQLVFKVVLKGISLI